MAQDSEAGQPPRGRRGGDARTREDLLDAALALFAEHGYDGASMRAIAARAGTDPGMIRHYFGDKEGLFVETVLDRTPTVTRLRAAFMDGSPGQGRRLADAYFSLWEDPSSGPMLRALVRSALPSRRAPEFMRHVIGGAALDEPDTGDPALRGLGLAGGHLLGVALMRYVVEIPLMATIPRDELLDQIGPVIDGYLASGLPRR
ncbi:TetR family transcriptional regulator [Demequina activiva]|uniref:HTH tetR-type domain-containing protein n=1 Tax=Demequina activiva TaxID=1582364 RepID=A0A919UM12_9MICO|nr:TetR family transcriptional regulator [Demequina activiva]GIG55243.1 hypothetical protein Dac01nite_19950 [Demequina activiva]